jgi:hypothetical protein
MNTQEYFKMAVGSYRKESFDKSDQLTLGELILKLEPIVQKAGNEGKIDVVYDFGSLFPTDIDSWRGSYNELALNYTNYDDSIPLTVIDFYSLLKSAIGKTFTGYKGGDFIMTKNTPVWVSNYGDDDNTAVIEVVDNGYQVILITGYREY